MPKLVALIMALSVTGFLAGCTGKEGPAGPEGPGSQVIHNLNITPTTASGSVDIAASEIVIDPSNRSNSTVTCYIVLSGASGVEVAIPTTRVESDNTTTEYTYQIRTGSVTVSWRNSGSTVPPIAQIVVTVINHT